MKSKRNTYKNIMERSLATMYQRMDLLLATIPQGTNLNKDKRANKVIRDVMAMEEEWIVDPDLRQELTMIDLHEQ
tara:strand:- start:833 stop:1057 length:225 start_codon:yes stop_codon:yes gene_type:complete